MGVAERTKEKHKHDSAKTAAAVRAGGERTKTVIGVAVVGVLALAVIGGVLLTRPQTTAPAGPQPVDMQFPAQREGATVVAGKPGAGTTIDVYEDFLCPGCGQLESGSGKAMADAINAGKLRVNYHPVPYLNSYSNPPGYSMDSANASLCAADAGKFAPYHASLFGSQPREGGEGYNDNVLVELGRKVGINGPEFEQCVRGNQHDKPLQNSMQQASNNPKLQQDSGSGKQFTTPTVVHNGGILQVTRGDAWLRKLLGGPRP